MGPRAPTNLNPALTVTLLPHSPRGPSRSRGREREYTRARNRIGFVHFPSVFCTLDATYVLVCHQRTFLLYIHTKIRSILIVMQQVTAYVVDGGVKLFKN